jgi:uncharacterized protein with HEPN domain
MPGQIERRLHSILRYCIDIESTVKRFGNDYDVFTRDSDYYDSISMKLFQICELAKNLPENYMENTKGEVHWREIIGMRNRFAHSYLEMSDSIIWGTITRDIPLLKRFCEKELQLVPTKIESRPKSR